MEYDDRVIPPPSPAIEGPTGRDFTARGDVSAATEAPGIAPKNPSPAGAGPQLTLPPNPSPFPHCALRPLAPFAVISPRPQSLPQSAIQSVPIRPILVHPRFLPAPLLS